MRTVCDATDVRGALCMANVDGLPMFGRLVVAGVAVEVRSGSPRCHAARGH